MRRKLVPLACLPLLSAPYFLYDPEPQLFVWGCNTFGQLGSGNTVSSPLPLPLSLSPEKIYAKGPLSGCIQKGHYYLWGRNKGDIVNTHSIDNVLLPTQFGEAEEVALGYSHMGIVKNNTIRLWGSDSHGKLGREAAKKEGFSNRNFS